MATHHKSIDDLVHGIAFEIEEAFDQIAVNESVSAFRLAFRRECSPELVIDSPDRPYDFRHSLLDFEEKVEEVLRNLSHESWRETTAEVSRRQDG